MSDFKAATAVGKLINKYPIFLAVGLLAVVTAGAVFFKPYFKKLTSKAGSKEQRVLATKTMRDSTGQLFGSAQQINVGANSLAGFDSPLGNNFGYENGSSKIDATAPVPDANGVIVEFAEPSVWARFSNDLQNNSVTAYRQELDSKHNTTIRNIERILKVDLVNGKSTKSGQRRVQSFTEAINALAVYDVPVEETQKALKNVAGIKRVLPNYTVRADLLDSPGLIGAPDAWKKFDDNGKSILGQDMKIGIVDTGIDYTHVDLGGCFGAGCKVAGGHDFINFDNDPYDDHGHGTHVAATAAGEGFLSNPDHQYQSLIGVAPEATLYAYKVLDSGGSGLWSTVIAGIQACADPDGDGDPNDRMDVCNLSLGGYGDPDDPVAQALDTATSAGTLFVVAAGNSGPWPQTIGTPGVARKALTVAASCKPADVGTDSYCEEEVASFSSRGPVRWLDAQGQWQQIDKPDITAPGHKICAAQHDTWLSDRSCGDSDHISISGTSMATPHVAGAAALLKQTHPFSSPEELKNLLMQTARDLKLPNWTQGAGIVNLTAAVESSQPVYLAEGRIILKVSPVHANENLVSKTVVMVNNSATDHTYTITTQLPDGLQLNNKNLKLTIPSNSQINLDLAFSLDASVARSGTRLAGQLIFTDTGNNVTLKAPVVIAVAHRLFADPADGLDYDLDYASSSTWTQTRELVLNSSVTESQTYNVQVSCCNLYRPGDNNNITASAPPTVKIGAGKPLSVPITLNANNQGLENGRYYGIVTLTSTEVSSAGDPLERISLPITFYKGYAIRFHYESREDKPLFTVMHSQQPTDWVGYAFRADLTNGNDTTVYLPWESVFNIENEWISNPNPQEDAILTEVFYENIDPRSTIPTVNVRSSDATNRINFDLKTPDGNDFSGTTGANIRFSHRTTGYAWGTLRFGPLLPGSHVLVSDVSDNYDFLATINGAPIVDNSPRPTIISLVLGQGFSGGKETNIHIGPEDYAKTPLSLEVANGVAVGQSCSIPYVAARPLGARIPLIFCAWSSGMNFNADSDGTTTLYSASNDPRSPDEFDYPNYGYIRIGRTNTASSDNSTIRYGSPYLTVDQKQVYGLQFGFGPPIHDDLADWYENHKVEFPGIIGSGSGLMFDIMRWYSRIGQGHKQIILTTNLGYSVLPHQFSDGSDEFFYQYSSNPEDVYVSGRLVRDGATVFETNNTPFEYGFGTFDVVPGSYQWQLTRDVIIGGLATTLRTESSFKVPNGGSDKPELNDINPPNLKSLWLTHQGSRPNQSSLFVNENNRFEFKLTPGPGLDQQVQENPQYFTEFPDSLKDVTFESASNEGRWHKLILLKQGDGKFSATFRPEKISAYSFRISASDAAGNTFKFTFSVPTISGPDVPKEPVETIHQAKPEVISVPQKEDSAADVEASPVILPRGNEVEQVDASKEE